MNNFITAEEARRNAESCRNVVAENPIMDVAEKRLFISGDGEDDRLEDIVLSKIFKEIAVQSYRGKRRAKILISDEMVVNNTDFTKISSRLKDCGFDSIYGGNDKEVEMLVEW